MNNLDKVKDFAEKFDKFRNHLEKNAQSHLLVLLILRPIKKIKISLIILWKKKLGELNMIQR